eukprot:3936717-Rhodomonas_salina.2
MAGREMHALRRMRSDLFSTSHVIHSSVLWNTCTPPSRPRPDVSARTDPVIHDGPRAERHDKKPLWDSRHRAAESLSRRRTGQRHQQRTSKREPSRDTV